MLGGEIYADSVRVTRVAENEYRSEDIADVSFVPLIGEEGWAAAGGGRSVQAHRALRPASVEDLPSRIHPQKSPSSISMRPVLLCCAGKDDDCGAHVDSGGDAKF